MKLAKATGRLASRRRSWDAAGYPQGYKRPGSFKKSYPRGRGKSHKERAA